MVLPRLCLLAACAVLLTACSDGLGSVEAGSAGRQRAALASAGAPSAPPSIVFHGVRANYLIVKSGDGFMVSDNQGTDGERSVAAGSRLLFADQGVAFDLAGAAGQTYRLYQAAFDRTPDRGGLSFWLAQMDKGASLRQLASAFIGSAEFAALYGAAPSTESFVTNLYNNVLHRAYDQGGFDFWVAMIRSGSAREDVLAAFSESAENVARTGAAIAGGIDYTPVTSSFALLQSRLFGANCTTCHSSTLASGGLVLDARAYANLVNVTPQSLAAAGDGLKRVLPGNAANSLLYQKLLMWDPAHAPRYGAAMPLGGGSLSVGQIEFVRRWIAAGAPETGEVADAALLDDTTIPAPQPFEPLAPPPAGQGFQITTGLFTVAPEFERELFIYRKLGNANPIYVSKIETRMRNNSHHLLAYTFNANTPASVFPAVDTVRDIRNPDNSLNFLNMVPMGYHTFFGGSMTINGGYTFPPGVAMRLPADTALDLNSHFVNTGATPILGEAFVNLHTIDAAQVQHTAFTLELDNTSMVLQPNSRSTVSKGFTFKSATKILMLTSHSHARGEHFVIRINGGTRNGEKVYENFEWDSPQIVTFDPPISLKAGEGLTSEITYNNTSTRVITFGLSSEDEMGIIFGYAY
ncbi:MAG: DUF4214 domain-containing protein [Pseudomonadota bacterium]